MAAVINFFVNDVGLWPIITNWLQTEFRYTCFAFTPYSSPTVWNNAFGTKAPLDQIITSQTFLD
jgi:hypothetical protein